MSSPLDAADLRARVQHCLDAELDHQEVVLREVAPDVLDLLEAIRALLSGGKRLRAAFLFWGYRAAGGADSPALVRLATSMEMFQAAALLHDDVMDDSDTRRGRSAAHRWLADEHARRAWSGDGAAFGVAGAILAGNLCLGWTEELYSTSGLPAHELERARPYLDRMRTQLMAGQYLDVVESVRPWTDLPRAERLARAERVIHFKSAKYTIEHPLVIGAAASGLDDTRLGALAAYGLDLGHAFQLRDDVLGVFGDPAATGKPAGDDLREGKRTVLVAHALDLASVEQARWLEGVLGRKDLGEADVERARDLLTTSGALARVEAEISALADRARSALGRADLPDASGAAVLGDLVATATAREV